MTNNYTRRLKLQFDKDGTPGFNSCTSPESFKQRGFAVLPPHDVIPVIFVPGIMGSNLMNRKSNEEAWRPPNGKPAALKVAWDARNLSPADRQELFNAADTKVDNNGPCNVPDTAYWLTTEEAHRRGWGGLHSDSYLKILLRLEATLNDVCTLPGLTEERGSQLLPDIGMLEYLDGGPDKTKDFRQHAWNTKPDYAAIAKKAMTAWGARPKALSIEEIQRLGDYYFPVWAFGYNWLRSNKEAGDLLVKKIDEIIDGYSKIPYFNCVGKVILVTHSMGGLVGRWAAKEAGGKILGVVHCVQPVAGAPVVYRRFRSGTESGAWSFPEKAFAAIVGNDAAKLTPALAAPGPLELLPTRHYPPGWLRVTRRRGMFGEAETLHTLPKSDPYEEIYGKTTDDCWWGMVDPALLDPAGLHAEVNKPPIEAYDDALTMARDFHAELQLTAHPQTYGFYGVDEGKHPAFGHVAWEVTHSGDMPPDLMARKDRGRSLNGHATVPLKKEIPPDDLDTAYTLPKTFALLNERNQAGDGTVPADSGCALERLNPQPKDVINMAGMDHQNCFDHLPAGQALIYGIARVIQQAPPPTPPKCMAPPNEGAPT